MCAAVPSADEVCRLYDLSRTLRYAAIGMLNTGVGYGLIMFWRWLGLPELLANAMGYALGLCLSFLLHRSWTFVNRHAAPGAAWRFMAMALAAWALNATCVWALLRIDVAAPLAHAVGMPVYSLVFYLGIMRWVFRPPPATGERLS